MLCLPCLFYATIAAWSYRASATLIVPFKYGLLVLFPNFRDKNKIVLQQLIHFIIPQDLEIICL